MWSRFHQCFTSSFYKLLQAFTNIEYKNCKKHYWWTQWNAIIRCPKNAGGLYRILNSAMYWPKLPDKFEYKSQLITIPFNHFGQTNKHKKCSKVYQKTGIVQNPIIAKHCKATPYSILKLWSVSLITWNISFETFYLTKK